MHSDDKTQRTQVDGSYTTPVNPDPVIVKPEIHGPEIHPIPGARPTLPNHIVQRLDSFAYQHLPRELQEISRPFCELAHEVATRNPNHIETEDALLSLMRAKDSAVRAARAGAVG